MFITEALFLFSFYLQSLRPTDCAITPALITNFRGLNSTFRCNGSGSILWHVGDVPVSYKTVGQLIKQGITVDSKESGGQVYSNLTVQSSRDVNNNNTILKCVVISGNSIDTFTASLIIIDMTPVQLHFPESNSREFIVQWDKVYVPSGFTVLSYELKITDENGKVLRQHIDSDTSKEVYSYPYISEQSRSELPECSRRIFSVFVVTNQGNSESVEAAWEKLKPSKFDGLYCSIVNTSFVRVDFGNPVCPFEVVSYNIAVSLEGRQVVGSSSGEIDGDNVNILIKSSVALESSKTFEALVTIETRGEESTKKAVCFENFVTEAGLMGSSGSAGLNGGQIGAIFVAVLLLVVMLGILVASVVIVYIKRD